MATSAAEALAVPAAGPVIGARKAPKRGAAKQPAAGVKPANIRSKKQKVESVEGSSVQAVVLPKVDETASFTSEEVVQIRRNLLDWYDRNHRILPWRRNKHSKREASARDGEGNPGAPLDLPDQQFIYYVWVCEVMSQQTQVPRAAAYFKRWIAKWPTVQALAAASQDEVNEVWAGLGYYRRARFLLEGAQYIQRDLGGAFPTTSQELQKIPGVGAYTGNAMASIACNQPVAVVDANVVRVLARLRRLSADPRSGASVKLHALLANALVDPDRPGDFNQAMMELGATVCTVHQPPTCQDCPIRNQCQAVAVVEQFVSDGGDRAAPRAPTVVQYPSKVEKAQRREELVAVCVVELKPASGKAGVPSQYLLVQRPETGLLAGLWEFPSRAVDAGSTAKQCSQALDMYLHETLGLPIKGSNALKLVERRPLDDVVHIFSHIRMTLRAERLVLQGDVSTVQAASEDRPGIRWVSAADMPSEGLSSSVKKVLKLALAAAAADKGGIKRFFAARPETC